MKWSNVTGVRGAPLRECRSGRLLCTN